MEIAVAKARDRDRVLFMKISFSRKENIFDNVDQVN